MDLEENKRTRVGADMNTSYGPMQLEEYAKGKVRLVHNTGEKGSSLPLATRKAVLRVNRGNQDARSTTGNLARNTAPAPTTEYDSKLEQARATYLGYLVLAKDLVRVVHHPFSIELAPKRWYTPDFLIEFPDGRLQVEEVKGHLNMKNARDSITRLHVAAVKLPMFDWRLTMRIRGQWEERRIA